MAATEGAFSAVLRMARAEKVKTNQPFPILPDAILEKLQEKYVFDFWEKTTRDVRPTHMHQLGSEGGKCGMPA